MSEGKSDSNDMMKLQVDKSNNGLQLRSFGDIWNVSQLLVKSGLFGTGNASVVATKIITGLEMGIDPIRAVRHIDTIEGAPSVSAQLSAAMIRMSDSYKYEVEELSIEFNDKNTKVVDGRGAVTIYKYDPEVDEFLEKGTGEFLWGEAVVAGLTTKNNWSNYPRDMLFARAMKRAKRMYAPNVGIGREYMPDELGEDDNPTVSVPDEVVEEAQEADDVEIDQPDTSKPEEATNVDYEVEEDSGKEKGGSSTGTEDQTQEVQDHSPNSDDIDGEDESGSGFEMEVQSSPDKSTEEKTESEPATKPPKPEDDETDGEDELSEDRKIRNKVDDINAALSRFDDDDKALLYEVGKYAHEFTEWKDSYSRMAFDMLDAHIERMEFDYDERRKELTVPTQKIINNSDTNLEHLTGEDLKEQLDNYYGEAENWASPAKEVWINVLDRHKSKIGSSSEGDGEDDEPNGGTVNGITKGERAEFYEDLNTAKTRISMKMKDTHGPEELDQFVDAIINKVENETPTDEKMEDDFYRAITPFQTVVKLREAVTQGDIDTNKFDGVLSDFSQEIQSWDDKEEAKRVHDMITNEVKRLSEEVDGFEAKGV